MFCSKCVTWVDNDDPITCPECGHYTLNELVPCEHILTVLKCIQAQKVTVSSGDYAASSGEIECSACDSRTTNPS